MVTDWASRRSISSAASPGANEPIFTVEAATASPSAADGSHHPGWAVRMRAAIRAAKSTSTARPAPSSQMPAQNAVVGGCACRWANAASDESSDSGMCGATRKT